MALISTVAGMGAGKLLNFNISNRSIVADMMEVTTSHVIEWCGLTLNCAKEYAGTRVNGGLGYASATAGFDSMAYANIYYERQRSFAIKRDVKKITSYILTETIDTTYRAGHTGYAIYAGWSPAPATAVATFPLTIRITKSGTPYSFYISYRGLYGVNGTGSIDGTSGNMGTFFSKDFNMVIDQPSVILLGGEYSAGVPGKAMILVYDGVAT